MHKCLVGNSVRYSVQRLYSINVGLGYFKADCIFLTKDLRKLRIKFQNL